MGSRKGWLGFGTVATLIAINLFLGGLTVQEARAGDPGACDAPGGDVRCYCFGSACVDDFPGFDMCVMGWHPVNGELVLDPIYTEPNPGEYDFGEGESCDPSFN